MKTNNYPSWLVPIETAKKLKEIGFDKPSPFVLQYKRAVILSGYDFYCESGYIDLEIDVDEQLERVNSKEITIIPTWEQVLEWFRNKGFRISLENHEDSTKFMFYNMKINEGKHFKGEFSSYEKARKALVNKLIEVYEDSI